MNFVFTVLLIIRNSPFKTRQAKIGVASIVFVASLLGVASIVVMKDITPIPEAAAATGDDKSGAIAEGLKVVAKNKCTSCHIVNGEGTALGPDFDLIAKNSDLKTVREFLSNPKLARPGTAMQNVNLDEEEVDKLIAMFEAMGGKASTASAGGNEDLGLKILKEKCLSCHEFKGEGGTFGPSLTDVKNRKNEKEIVEFIKNPTGGMPTVALSEEELSAVSALLSGGSSGASAAASTASKGLEIIKGKCQGCHTYKGEGGSMGPDLTDVKSRKDAKTLTTFINSPSGSMPPMGLSDDDLRAVVDELTGAAGGGAPAGSSASAGNTSNGEQIIKSQCLSCHAINGEGGTFGPDLKKSSKDAAAMKEFIKNPSGGMPPVGLTDAQIDDVISFLKGGAAAGKPKTAAPAQASSAAPAKATASTDFTEGIKIYKENCQSCHKVNGEGGSFAPDLTKIGSRMKKEQISNFVMNPKGGMPPLGLPVDQVTKVSEYLYSLSVNAKPAKAAAATLTSIQGKELYRQHACSGCHKLDGKGGDFGPDLSKIGSKRDKQWLSQFLANPPEKMTITPLTKEEIDELANYLMQFK